LTSKATH